MRDRADEVVRLAGAVVSRIKSEVPEGRRHLICSHSWRTAVPCEEKIQQAKHTGQRGTGDVCGCFIWWDCGREKQPLPECMTLVHYFSCLVTLMK